MFLVVRICARMSNPFVLICLLALAACGLMLIVALTYYWPRHALASGYLIVLIAGTKFRERLATATLAGELDWQVGFELTLYGVLGIITTMSILSTRAGHRRFAMIECGLIGYAALAAASTFWSFAPALTAVRAFQLIVLVGYSLAAVQILGTPNTLRAVSWALVPYVLICSAIAWIFPSSISSTEAGGRFTWFALHPISAGTYAGLAAVFVLSRVLSSDGARRWFGSAPWLIPLLAVLLLTNSRGPLLAFLAAAAIVLLKRTPSAAIRSLMLVGLLAMAVGAAATTSVQNLVRQAELSESRLVQRLFRDQDADTVLGLSGRAELWEALLPVFLDRPLLGHGYQGSRARLLDIASWAAYAHNAFLQTLLDVGSFGALLLCIPIGWTAIGALWFPLRTDCEGADAAALGATIFVLLNSVTSESFAGATGCFEMVLLMSLISAAVQRDWRANGAFESRGHQPDAAIDLRRLGSERP